MNGYEEITQLLLEAKADLTVKDYFGDTALSYAEKCEFTSIVAF